MSLNWNIQKVANCDEVCYVVQKEDTDYRKAGKYLSSVTECLIWATMAVGMDKITEKNWKEFYTRLKMVEACSGCYLRGENKETGKIEDIPFTVQNVKDHIGLHTNASIYSKTRFLNNMFARIEDRANSAIRSYNAEQKDKE